MNPKVFLVTGTCPPDPCGVGDYTTILASSLEAEGQAVDVICHRSWSPRGTSAVLRRLLAERDALVHMQYPTMGYGYSLGPQCCALARECIVTIHEFTAAHKLRKLSLIPFTLRSPCVVMTSEFERDALVRRMPWVRERLRVIPVGSNIPQPRYTAAAPDKSVAYFGLIMPRKGLEDFVEFAKIAREMQRDWEISIIGKIAPRQEDYARRMVDATRPYGVQWIFDRNPEEVSALLARTGLCYLPFPDGASERRGSLKAACAAGLPCVTTRGEHTPLELLDAVVMAKTPLQAVETATYLMNDRDERVSLSQRARKYAQRFAWQTIAASHVQMYSELWAARANNARRTSLSP